MASRKSGKYSKELAQIKMLKSINSVLKTSDMENALLSNSAKDSETVSDGMVDEMLGRINTERERNRDIFDVEKLTSTAVYTSTAKRRPAPKRSARRAASKKKAPAKRKSAPKRKKPQKKKRRR